MLGILIPLTGRLIPVLTLLRVAVIGFPVNNSKPLILAGRKSSQLLIRFSLTWQYFLKQSVLLGHKVKFILCHFYLKVMCPVWPSHRSLCHNQWRAVNTSRQKRKVLPLYDRRVWIRRSMPFPSDDTDEAWVRGLLTLSKVNPISKLRRDRF